MAKRIIKTATMVMLVIVPLIFSTRLHNPFTSIKVASLQVILLVMVPVSLYLHFRGSAERSWKNPIAPFVLSWLLISILSMVNSVHPLTSLTSVLTLCVLAVLYFIWILNLSRLDCRHYFTALVVTGLVISIYALLQHWGIDFPGITWDRLDLVRSRSIGTFGNPTFLAGFLVMVIPLSLYLLLETEASRGAQSPYAMPSGGKVLFLAAWALSSLALLLTYTRGAWVAFAVSHIFILVMCVGHLKSRFRSLMRSGMAMLLLLICLCVAVSFTTKGELTIFKRAVSFRDIDIIYVDRVFLWKIALLNLRDNPLLGSGPGTFSFIFPKYRYVEPISNRGRVAMPEGCHNEVLEVASSTGVPGLMAYLGLIISGIYLGLRLIRVSPAGEKLKWICLVSCCIAYVIHNFFLYPTISSDMAWWFYMSLISIEFARPASRASMAQGLTIPQKVLLVLAVTASLLLMAMSLNIVRGNHLVKRAWEYDDARNWKASYEAFNRAISCDPWNYKYYQYRGKMLEGIFREKPLAILPPETIGSYRAALELNPLDSYCWADLGRFYGYMTGNFDPALLGEAEKCYLRAIALDPYNPLFCNDLANLYAMCGRDDEALRYYKKGYELYPYSAIINYNLGRYYFSRKNFTAARTHLKEALKADPEYVKAKELLKEMEGSK